MPEFRPRLVQPDEVTTSKALAAHPEYSEAACRALMRILEVQEKEGETLTVPQRTELATMLETIADHVVLLEQAKRQEARRLKLARQVQTIAAHAHLMAQIDNLRRR